MTQEKHTKDQSSTLFGIKVQIQLGIRKRLTRTAVSTILTILAFLLSMIKVRVAWVIRARAAVLTKTVL